MVTLAEKLIQINNIVPPNPPQDPEIRGKGFGHRFKGVFDDAEILFVDAFRAIGEVFNKRSPLGKCYKLSIHVLTGIGHVAGPHFRGAGLLKALGIVDNVNDAFDLFHDTEQLVQEFDRHVVNKKKLEEADNPEKDKINPVTITATLAFFTADLGGLTLWLNDLKFLDLARASASIGKGFSKLATALGPNFAKFTNAAVKTLPIITKVAAKMTLVNVIRGVVGFAFVALAVNECIKMSAAIRERNWKEVINSSLQLVSCVAEVALKVLVIASFTCVPALVAVGCIAAGFGLAAFIMEVVCKFQKERAEERRALAM